MLALVARRLHPEHGGPSSDRPPEIFDPSWSDDDQDYPLIDARLTARSLHFYVTTHRTMKKKEVAVKWRRMLVMMETNRKMKKKKKKKAMPMMMMMMTMTTTTMVVVDR